MRGLSILLLLCALIYGVAAASWTNQEHELFDIVAALEKAEGKGTTFYSFLNITKSATAAEINRAYRKRSLELHPDKNPLVKNIGERFERLGVIGAILRDEERRKSYDFFHDNGVPRWRGTGYYYARWRPGFITALVFLALVSSFSQYLIQHITYRSDIARVRDVQQRARSIAYGKGGKAQGRKRVKVPLGGGGEDGAEGKRDRPTLTVEVAGEEVWLVTEDGLEPLDDSAATLPSWRRTWPVALVQRGLNSVLKQKEPAHPTSSGLAPPEEAVTDGEGKSDDDAVKGGARRRKTGKSKR